MDGSRKIAVGIERMNEEYLQEQASNIDEEEFDKELGKVTNKKKAVFTYRKRTNQAPYGLKKDGTPKAKPGKKA
jgi:hypothetical protein